MGLKLYPLPTETLSSYLLQSALRPASCCKEKTSGGFFETKRQINSLQIHQQLRQRGREEAVPLPQGCNETAWALITGREILAGHQGNHSDGKDREVQEWIASGEQRLCHWRHLRQGVDKPVSKALDRADPALRQELVRVTP